jgi:hypothetical protein
VEGRGSSRRMWRKQRFSTIPPEHRKRLSLSKLSSAVFESGWFHSPESAPAIDSLNRAHSVPGDVFGNEELVRGSGSLSVRDGEDVPQDGAGEVTGVGEVVGGFLDEVFIPRLRGEGDEGKIAGDIEILLGHPGNEGEGVPGPGGDDGGGRV